MQVNGYILSLNIYINLFILQFINEETNCEYFFPNFSIKESLLC